MEQLSSCYFCGASLDAQIEPYRVVPAALDADEEHQRAVSLCPSCRQKLAQVVETVVAATGENAPEMAEDVATPAPEGDILADEPVGDVAASGPAGDDATESDSRSEPPGETSPSSLGGDDDPVGEATSESDDHAGDGGHRSAAGQRGDEGGQTTTETSTAGSGQSRDPLSVDEAAADRSSPAQSTDGSERRAETGADGDRDGQTAARTESASSATEEPSLTALEYNKVMRLLQNRAFPVDKAEIKDVAINAYEISEQEFDAIIDAAIDRGLIDEDEGQFVESE